MGGHRRRVAAIGALLGSASFVTAAAQQPAAASDTASARPPLTSTFTLPRELLRSLPIDDPRDALALYPGVVSRDDARGVLRRGDAALRGAAAGAASVYVDGAPARRWLFGSDGIVPGLAAIEEIVVTTGVTEAAVADARGGTIAYAIREGGPTVAGDFRATSDEPFGAGSTVGYNAFEGWVGGPLPGIGGLTWFLAGVAQGQGSQYRASSAAGIPLFVTGATDTVVSTTGGDPVALPQYVQWSGECGTVGNANSPIGRDIQGNYGADCHGLGQAMDWSSALRLHGKLTFAYGAGGTVSLTGLTARLQERRFPGEVIGAPTLFEGLRTSSSMLVANWRQPLRLAGRDAAVRVILSLGDDRSIAGPLAPSSETTTRDPALGIEFGALRFEGEDILPVPITEAIVRNVRTNSGLRVPYLGRSDLGNVQPWRLNPYGLIGNGWYTSGLGTTLTFGDERRVHANASLQWQPIAGHRVALGGDADRVEASFYTSYMLDQTQFDAFIVSPRRWGLYASDEVVLGRAIIEVGARWDHFSSDALYPRTPGRVFTHPRAFLYPDAVTNDSAYAAYLADDSIWTRAESRTAVSPSIRVGYAVGPATHLRASYGQHVESPSLTVLYRGSSNDLANTPTAAPYGRDVAYRKVSMAELGARHAVSDAWMIDGAVYRLSGLRPYRNRFAPFADPADPTDTLFLVVLEDFEGVTATGLDLRFDWRRPAWLEATLGYAVQRTSQESSDALTTQAVTAVVGFTVRDQKSDGSAVSPVIRGLSAHATMRLTSGVYYTPLENTGGGWTIADGFRGRVDGSINGSQLPWTRHLDLRVDKGWRAAGLEWSVFLDVRNLLGFDNQVDVFTETGGTENLKHRTETIGDPAVGSREYAQLWSEASTAGALGGDGTTIDLRGNCQAWPEPVNCTSLVRVENRFGDGDGLYTLAEQERAFNAFYDSFFGPSRFYEAGRTLRLGLDIAF